MTQLIDQLKSRYPDAVPFKFGDSESLCVELLALVRNGKKTGTCAALSAYTTEEENLPTVGRRDIALNWDDTPALVIETTSVALTRFCDVTEEFALSEGENDSLAGWQADHKKYFERNGGFDPTMVLVCERFCVVEIIE